MLHFLASNKRISWVKPPFLKVLMFCSDIHAQEERVREGEDICHCKSLLKHSAAGRSGFSLALSLHEAQMLFEE